MAEARYHRQELLFGAEGQEKIDRPRIAIVGLGGLGSHVAQQLAHLGVRSFVLVDNDKVSPSSLNRLVGSVVGDATAKRLKIEVGRRMILSIQPDATVVRVPANVISAEAYDLLRQVDFVFGCMDNDPSRLLLNEVCQAYERPYFDLASDVNPEDRSFGGRILYSDGNACVVCKDLLNQTSVRAAFSSQAQREEDERIYGVSGQVLEDVGPSVVSLNGIIASLAVTEFMVEVTGLRQANLYVEYRGELGVVFRDSKSTASDCYYCKNVRGRGANADTERHVRAGWGERLG